MVQVMFIRSVEMSFFGSINWVYFLLRASMKGWRMLNWICLPVGELNPSTVALRSQGNRRGCWLVNFAHVARGVGVEFPIGPFGI